MFSAISVFKGTSFFLFTMHVVHVLQLSLHSCLSAVSFPSLCRTKSSQIPLPLSHLLIHTLLFLWPALAFTISSYLSFRYQFIPILGHDSALIPVITFILHGCFTVDVFTRRTEVAKWLLLYLLLTYAHITLVWYSVNNGLDILSCILWEWGNEWLSEKWIHFCYSTWKLQEILSRGNSTSESLCVSPTEKYRVICMHREDWACQCRWISSPGFVLNVLNEAFSLE